MPQVTKELLKKLRAARDSHDAHAQKVAEELIFQHLNPDVFATGRRAPPYAVIDLHHLCVRNAIEKLEKFIKCQVKSGKKYRSFRIITGRGLHSKGGKSVLRPVVLRYLEQHHRKWDVRVPHYNPGVVLVQRPPPKKPKIQPEPVDDVTESSSESWTNCSTMPSLPSSSTASTLPSSAGSVASDPELPGASDDCDHSTSTSCPSTSSLSVVQPRVPNEFVADFVLCLAVCCCLSLLYAVCQRIFHLLPFFRPP